MTTATVPTSHFLSEDPQVFEFVRWGEIVCVARWVVEPCGNRKHARRLTGQWRHSVESARQVWTQLKKSGARHFDGFED